MSDGFFKRGKVWWFRTDPLTGKQASSGKRDIKSAELEYRERSRRATNPEYQPEATEDASLNHWALKFVEHKAGFKSAATATFYAKKLGHVVRILGADTAISNALRPAAFDAYVRQRKAEGARATTILKEIGAAKTMAKFAARAGAYHGRPELFRPTELSDDYEPGERFLTPSELVSLLAVLPPHRAAHVALAVAIGCRFSESFRVMPGDVDTSAWLVHIRGTKTKRSRATVPVAEPFRALLTAALPYLPLRPWLNSNMKRDLAKACAKAGIAPVTSNDLRRTHGSWLAEAGVSDEHIGKVLRHADGRMARRVYGQLSPEKLGKLLETKTGPSARLTTSHHAAGSSASSTFASRCSAPPPAARLGSCNAMLPLRSPRIASATDLVSGTQLLQGAI
jgi:integrase